MIIVGPPWVSFDCLEEVALIVYLYSLGDLDKHSVFALARARLLLEHNASFKHAKGNFALLGSSCS